MAKKYFSAMPFKMAGSINGTRAYLIKKDIDTTIILQSNFGKDKITYIY